MFRSQKGDRKYNQAVLSTALIAVIAESVIIGAAMSPESGLAAAGAGIIGATALAIAAKDTPHAWGNAKEHQAERKAAEPASTEVKP